jgi:hypothetical protein
LKAAEGDIWEPDTVDRYQNAPRYVTQRRWIGTAAAVLGIASDLSSAVAGGIALLLGIPGTVHRRVRRELAGTRWLEDRGEAVAQLLDRLELNQALLARLLTAGHRAEIWRRPLLWDTRTGRCQRRSFDPVRAGPR